MAADHKKRLETAIAALQKRWGKQVIGRASRQPAPEVPPISTGFPALDAALGVGGIPRGRISELIGMPTSGMATVALKVLAQAQYQGGTAVYLDMGRTFDPDYARRCGVRLAQMVLVQPATVVEALSLLSDVMLEGGVDFLVGDFPAHLQEEPRTARQLTTALGRLLAPLSKSGSTLLFLTTLAPHSDPISAASSQGGALPHFATVRLLLQKERWLYSQRDVRGYEAQVLVLKNKLAAPGTRVRIAITFNGTVDGDGT